MKLESAICVLVPPNVQISEIQKDLDYLEHDLATKEIENNIEEVLKKVSDLSHKIIQNEDFKKRFLSVVASIEKKISAKIIVAKKIIPQIENLMTNLKNNNIYDFDSCQKLIKLISLIEALNSFLARYQKSLNTLNLPDKWKFRCFYELPRYKKEHCITILTIFKEQLSQQLKGFTQKFDQSKFFGNLSFNSHKFLFSDKPALRMQEGFNFSRGSYGSIKDVFFNGTVCVKKTSLHGNFKHTIPEGARFIGTLNNNQQFVEVDLIYDDSIVMEKGKTNLWYFSVKSKDLVFKNLLKIAEDLLLMLVSLEQNNITYGDWKLDNIIVFEEKDPELGFSTYKFKLCDFDSAHISGESHISPGTYIYLAPEMFKDNISCTSTKESNRWSVGVLLYFLIKEQKFTNLHNNLSFVKNFIQNLKQDDLNENLDRIFHKSKIFKSLGEYYTQKKLIELGISSAKQNLIALAEAQDDYSPSLTKQELLDKGVVLFKKKHKNTNSLEIFFLNCGITTYLENHSFEDLKIEEESLGREKLKKLIDIIKGLLQIEPSKRINPVELYDKYFVEERVNEFESPSKIEFDYLSL